MARPKRQSYIVFVAGDGPSVKQWAVRVDRLLNCLALGVLLSVLTLAAPLVREDAPRTRPSVTPKQVLDNQTPGAGYIDVRTTRTLLISWLGLL